MPRVEKKLEWIDHIKQGDQLRVHTGFTDQEGYFFKEGGIYTVYENHEYIKKFLDKKAGILSVNCPPGDEESSYAILHSELVDYFELAHQKFNNELDKLLS